MAVHVPFGRWCIVCARLQLIIATWDEEMYEFGFKMGLPVFLYRSNVNFDMKTDMAYGSQASTSVILDRGGTPHPGCARPLRIP